ncbi:Tar ligand binding domain-containing protein [Enterobacter hormaechei]
MNLTQIFSRLAPRFIPRQFGLLTGIFCIIGLFSALQLSSSFLLTASLNEAQRNEQRNQLAWQQQSRLDQAVFLCWPQAIRSTAPAGTLCRIKRPARKGAGIA